MPPSLLKPLSCSTAIPHSLLQGNNSHHQVALMPPTSQQSGGFYRVILKEGAAALNHKDFFLSRDPRVGDCSAMLGRNQFRFNALVENSS